GTDHHYGVSSTVDEFDICSHEITAGIAEWVVDNQRCTLEVRVQPCTDMHGGILQTVREQIHCQHCVIVRKLVGEGQGGAGEDVMHLTTKREIPGILELSVGIVPAGSQPRCCTGSFRAASQHFIH